MLVFRRCGGQKPSHNICIITVPENVSCHAEPVGQDCFFDNSFSSEWKEQFSLSRFNPFHQKLLEFSLCLPGQSLLCSVKWRPWIHTSFLLFFCLFFFLSWGRTRTPESLSCGKDGFKWGETLPISQSGELPAACYHPVTAPGVSKPTKRVIVSLLQVDSVDRVGGGGGEARKKMKRSVYVNKLKTKAS